jgi:hypothetical protein
MAIGEVCLIDHTRMFERSTMVVRSGASGDGMIGLADAEMLVAEGRRRGSGARIASLMPCTRPRSRRRHLPNLGPRRQLTRERLAALERMEAKWREAIRCEFIRGDTDVKFLVYSFSIWEKRTVDMVRDCFVSLID